MLTVSGEGDSQARVRPYNWSGTSVLAKDGSSIGLRWPDASLLSSGRQCKSEGNVTGTVSPVSLAVPSARASVGSRSEDPKRQSDGQKQLHTWL